MTTPTPAVDSMVPAFGLTGSAPGPFMDTLSDTLLHLDRAGHALGASGWPHGRDYTHRKAGYEKAVRQYEAWLGQIATLRREIQALQLAACDAAGGADATPRA